MSGSQIALSIGAVDKTANAFDRVNSRIEDFQKKTQGRIDAATAPFRRLQAQMARFADVSGLTRVASATRGVARAAGELYGKLGQVVPLIGIIGGAASVAGVTRMVTAWSEWGLRVQQTSQRIGVGARQLTNLGGAASLAGSSADAMAGGLQGLGQSLYDAVGGRAPEVIVMMRTLGLNFQDAAGHARNAADVLPEIADKIAGMRNPFAQAQVATALFGGAAEGLLPILRLGAEGIRQYQAEAQRLNPVTEAGIKAAGRLALAQRAVSLATEGLRNRIAERLEPVLTPMLQHFADWIAASPAVARGVEWLGGKVEQLATWIDAGGIQRFGDTVNAWLQPIGAVAHALGGDDGALGALELLAAFMVGSFALKVIAPWWTLGAAITSATVKMARFSAAQAAGAGGAGKLGRLGGLLGGLGLAGMGWEGLNLAQDATEPSGNGLANLLHNFMFETDPAHWTQSYHSGQSGGGASDAAAKGLGRPDQSISTVGSPPTANMAARQKQAFDYYVSQGRTPQVAAGIVASLSRESLGNEKNDTGDGGTAYGIGQWHPDRQEHFRQIFGHDIRRSTFGEQLQFKRMELDGTGGDAGSASAGQMMRGFGTTARQAGGYDSRYAERPGDRDGEVAQRGALAEQILARQMQSPAMQPPQAQGAPLALASPDRRDGGGESTVRLQIDGKMDKGMNVSVQGAQGATVEGPLVERPRLLGAQP